jgi:hypothetical protein
LQFSQTGNNGALLDLTGATDGHDRPRPAMRRAPAKKDGLGADGDPDGGDKRSAEGARLDLELACVNAEEEGAPLAGAEAQHTAVALFRVFHDDVTIGEFRDSHALAIPAAHRTHSPPQASSHQSIADVAARSVHR